MNSNGLILRERLYAGCRKFATLQHRWQLSVCAAILFFIYLVFKNVGEIAYSMDLQGNALLLICIPAVMAVLVLVIFVLCILGIPRGSRGINSRIAGVGLSNSIGEEPVLVSREEIDKDFYRLTFLSVGGSIERWKDRKSQIESALNIFIDSIRYVDSERYLIAVACTDATNGIPVECQWHDYFLNKVDRFTVYLGIGIGGAATVELQITPHILIGGSTGSGKTVLLRCLLWQCYLQEAEIILADFKGGLDYSQRFKEITELVTDLEQFDQALTEIVERMKMRMALLAEAGCSNIWTYNNKYPDKKHLQHIIVAVDELAEVLDKTGLSREAKKDVESLEAKISTIARLGRALGVHLILSTQRPDANILAGQIKSNIDIRICGRADEVLSRIILDTSDAAELIPKDEQGLFLLSDDRMIRAFNFNEEDTE
ncbi:MAG: FtsK/SpoIIIE domain-containing protein [Marvinbryantia sp.]